MKPPATSLNSDHVKKSFCIFFIFFPFIRTCDIHNITPPPRLGILSLPYIPAPHSYTDRPLHLCPSSPDTLLSALTHSLNTSLTLTLTVLLILAPPHLTHLFILILSPQSTHSCSPSSAPLSQITFPCATNPLHTIHSCSPSPLPSMITSPCPSCTPFPSHLAHSLPSHKSCASANPGRGASQLKAIQLHSCHRLTALHHRPRSQQ